MPMLRHLRWLIIVKVVQEAFDEHGDNLWFSSLLCNWGLASGV